MVIRHFVSNAAAGLVALTLGVTLGVAAGTSGAFAQANVLKECGSQYQAAKAANELGGQTWQDYLKACKERIKAAAPAESAAPAEAAKPAEAEATKPTEAPAAEAPSPLPPPATTAAPETTPAPAAEAPAKPAEPKMTTKERQKKCAAEWKAQKAELKKSDPKITWPKYWSDCNKRLKGE